MAAEVALIPLKVWDAQLKRRAVAAIRPSALGGAYGNAGAAVLAYPYGYLQRLTQICLRPYTEVALL